MSRVLVSAGMLAKNPYLIEKIERRVWSVEELCYSLVESARYLDESIMDEGLLSWLDTECGLPSLASALQPFMGQSRRLSDFVSTILQFTGYVSSEKENETRQTVEIGGALKPLEKSIHNADELARNQHTYRAIAEYDAVLEEHPHLEKRIRAELERKKGVLYTDMFRFKQAAESFLRAYELTGDAESYLYYLTAVRLSLTKEEYVSFISEHPEAYEYSMTLEQRMSAAEAEYMKEASHGRIGRITSYFESGQMTNFELELDRLIRDLKKEYRQRIGELV